MKKVILCAAAMLFATMGFSQNESFIDQGKANTADVNQTSTIDLYNLSDDYQRGENDADIDQIGENSSIVEQRGDNYAKVFQMGFSNSELQQSEVYQQGKNNVGIVTQWGDGNESYIDQDNHGGGHTPGAKKGNMALVWQWGYNNDSDIDQDNDANFASTTQWGNWNDSFTEQISDGPADGEYLQVSLVEQFGEANLSDVYQEGSDNFSNVLQHANTWMPDYSHTNEAYVDQFGELNTSWVYQNDCEMVNANNMAEVTQTNTIGSLGGNWSSVMQKGANTANVTQVNGID
jgi:hypothetical protein